LKWKWDVTTIKSNFQYFINTVLDVIEIDVL